MDYRRGKTFFFIFLLVLFFFLFLALHSFSVFPIVGILPEYPAALRLTPFLEFYLQVSEKSRNFADGNYRLTDHEKNIHLCSRGIDARRMQHTGQTGTAGHQ
jgi:hypothetical protein